MLGVIGGPLIFASSIAVLFGAYEQDGLHALFSVPEGAFEAAFAIYLIVKGFRPSVILDDARYAGGDGGPCGGCPIDVARSRSNRRPPVVQVSVRAVGHRTTIPRQVSAEGEPA